MWKLLLICLPFILAASAAYGYVSTVAQQEQLRPPVVTQTDPPPPPSVEGGPAPVSVAIKAGVVWMRIHQKELLIACAIIGLGVLIWSF